MIVADEFTSKETLRVHAHTSLHPHLAVAPTSCELLTCSDIPDGTTPGSDGCISHVRQRIKKKRNSWRELLPEQTWCRSSLLLRRAALDAHQLSRNANICTAAFSESPARSWPTSAWRNISSVEVESPALFFTRLSWKKSSGS